MTTTGVWRPLSARRAGDDQWYEKLPAALADQLREWIDGAGRDIPSSDLDRVLVRLHLPFRDQGVVDSAEELTAADYHVRLAQFLAYRSSERRLLDIADACLDFIPVRPLQLTPLMPLATRLTTAMQLAKPDHRRLLQQHLDDARFVFRIADDGRSLVRRIDASAASARQDAITAANASLAAGSAADFLRSGWAAIDGLHPDAPRAYSDAIKAVEAAAHALVQPRNTKATLGTMLRELRSMNDRYSVQIGPTGSADGTVLIHMIELLWTGQTSRHGSQHPTRLEATDEARAALHLATTLVAWFTSGAVTHRGQP